MSTLAMAILEQCGICDMIDERIEPDPQRILTPGKAVKLMVGAMFMGMGRRPLYLFDRLYASAPLELLCGEGVVPKNLNARAFSRALDDIFALDLPALTFDIYSRLAERYLIAGFVYHIDSTNFGVTAVVIDRDDPEMLCEELGTKDSFTYITYGSASESIAALLGNHVDIAISKPAAANQYVVSGDIVPVLALSTTRFSTPFDTAPTLSELGYNDVEYPMWRGVIGAKNMSDEAVAFWADAFKKVSETEEWQKNYLERNLLVSQYMGPEEASAVMYEAQAAAQAQN